MKYLLLLLICISPWTMFGQTYNFSPESILPPPVNAASINKGGEVNVNLANGTPNVAIPLFDVKSRFLGFPVTLNYASNGIRVNELASNVGLGWSLNCGGSVTRTTLGLPDEDRAPGMNNFNRTNLYTLDRSALNHLNVGGDMESDIFNFSVNGYISGTFIVDSSGQPKLLDEKSYKISLIDPVRLRKGFEITDDQGNVFLFNLSDTSNYDRGSCGNESRATNVYNAWHLTKIIKPYQDTIYFNYVPDEYTYISDLSESESICDRTSVGGCGGGSNGACALYSSTYNRCITRTEVRGNALKEIVYGTGKLVFNYQSGRADLTWGSSLAGISQLSAADTIRQVVFRQTNNYYGSTIYSSSPMSYRLFLRKVQVRDVVTKDSSYQYSFSYLREDRLPGRMALSQDLYGMPNGKGNNYLLTSFALEYPSFNESIMGTGRYGDRSVDTNFVYAGMLNKVEYPTGGYDTLVYDYNRKYEKYYVFHPATDFGLELNGTTTGTIADSANLTIPFTQQASLTFSTVANFPNYTGHHQGTLQIRRISDNALIYNALSNPNDAQEGYRTATLSLTAGTYKVRMTSQGNQISTNMEIRYQALPPDTLERDAPIGGVSIAKITSVDPVAGNRNSRSYSYRYRKTGKHSTVPIVEYVRYAYDEEVKRFMNCSNSYDCTGLATCHFLVHNTSMVPAESLFGGSFYYHEEVIETVEGNDNIDRSIAHTFQHNQTFTGEVQQGALVPGTPYGIFPRVYIGEAGTYYYSRNRLTSQIIPYRSVRNVYEQTNKRIVDNMKVMKIYDAPCISTPPSTVETSAFNIMAYPIFYQKSVLTATYDTTFSNMGASWLANIATYTYTDSPYCFVRTVATTNSAGEVKKSATQYIFDSPSNPVHGVMVARQQLSPVSVTDSVGNAFVHSNTIAYQYTDVSQTIIEPRIFQEKNGAGATDTTAEKTMFNSLGNVLEVKVKEKQSSFLWDYNNSFLVASVVNAAQPDVAYTSFEAEGKGNWNWSSGTPVDTAGYSGKKSFRLQDAGGGGISKSGLTSGTVYLLSYVTRNGSPYSISGTQGMPLQGVTLNGWTQYQHRITGVTSIALTGNGLLDELRLYPAGAQMTTYTYRPQTGVSSLCDANGLVLQYEYDGLGRLKQVRNHRGEIVNLYDYKYQAATNE